LNVNYIVLLKNDVLQMVMFHFIEIKKSSQSIIKT
jgi:hypothetical protein